MRVSHPFGNYFLQNDVQLRCPHFFKSAPPPLRRHLNDITPECFTNGPPNFEEVLGMQRGNEITRNVTLEVSSLRDIVKRSRGKKQQEETEKQKYVIVTENWLFKGFTTKCVQNYDRK